MKRRTQEQAAMDTVLPQLRRLYEDACRVVRGHDDGYCCRYRRERRRLFGVALKAVKAQR